MVRNVRCPENQGNRLGTGGPVTEELITCLNSSKKMTFDDFVSAILHGGFITLSIFILLLILSVCTWGIIISKILQLKREDKKNAAFVKAFNAAEDILEFCDVNKRRGMVDYDLGIVFEEVVNVQQKFEKDYPELNFADSQMKVLKEDFDNMVKHTVDRVSNQMAERRETLLSVLATTSNIAPFLGVLGTVVGIINAFTAIGNMGSADLSVVAPAISEALVATALGIFVAIPSSAAFNMISYWTQILGQKFDRFTMILLNRMQLELISRYKKTEEFGKF